MGDGTIPQEFRRVVYPRTHSNRPILLHLILAAFLGICAEVIGSDESAISKTKSVADAYQRSVFVLGLNPSPWDQVLTDAVVIADSLSQFDSDAAKRLPDIVRAMEKSRSFSQPPLGDNDLSEISEEGELDVMPDDEASRQVFVALTRSVSTIITDGLKRSTNKSGNEQRRLIDSAHNAYGAFAPTIRRYDPKSFQRLELDWSELLRELPEKPADNMSLSIAKAQKSISDYIQSYFGPGYSISNNDPLLPIPKGSLTLLSDVECIIALPPGSQTQRPIPRPRQLLNSVERGSRERDMILSSLGAAAFNNPFVFGEPARSLGISCNSCHEKSGNNPGFFIPGLSSRSGNVDVSNSFFAPHGNNGVFDPLDIPDLRGIRFTAPYGRNGRFASLREFTRNVIVNEFNGDEPDPILLDAMIIYMNEFDFAENPSLDGNGTLNHRASPAARRGEAIFNRSFESMGNLSCASCHVPSANFLDHQRHDIGTVKGATEFSHDRALDTPTLLGAAFTAPYFHDGSQPTLAAVVAWFNNHFDLGLSAGEAADLTAYVATVGNGTHVFATGDNFILEDLEDQDSFMAGFEFLEQRGKWHMIEDLFRGIGREVRRQASIAQNPDGAKALTRLGTLMDDAVTNIKTSKFTLVKENVTAWREQARQARFVLP